MRESTHDCGELGGLAQTRKRFLLVARHREKVPPFLYQPVKRALRAVGDGLDRLPLPGFTKAGPMHRLPALHWKTWVRLAFVEAGSDWRSLQKLRVVDGKLADYLIVPEMHGGVLGVAGWDETSHTITGNARQEIKMYWGKSGVASQSNGSSVFNSTNRYCSVMHLNGNVLDSTGSNIIKKELRKSTFI